MEQGEGEDRTKDSAPLSRVVMRSPSPTGGEGEAESGEQTLAVARMNSSPTRMFIHRSLKPVLQPSLIQQEEMSNQKTKRLRKILPIIVGLLIGSFLIGSLALAQLQTGLEYGTYTGLGTQDIRISIMKIVRAALAFLGVLAVLIVMYGGFIWMTAAGNAERIEKAKKILVNGLIGLVIILTSVGITTFIINQLLKATGAVETCEVVGAREYCDYRLAGCPGERECLPAGFWSNCAPVDLSDPSCDSTTIRECRVVSITPTGSNRPLNSVVRVRFNHGNIQPNADDITVTDTTLEAEVAVDKVINGSLIEITAQANCPAPWAAYKCFAANHNFEINVNAGTLTCAGYDLTCGGLSNPCTKTFSTGDFIDTEAPTVAIVPTQVCQAANNNLKAIVDDDYGIAYVDFKDTTGATDILINTDNRVTVPPAEFATVNWDTSGYDVDEEVEVNGVAVDYDLNITTSTPATDFTIRAGHCCNNTKDEDETDVDCGGADCESCEPVIEWVWPLDGRAATTLAAHNGNMITIHGRRFGSAGTITFVGTDDGGTDDRNGESPSNANSACTVYWSDTEVIILIPYQAQTGPIKLTRTDEFFDETPYDFTINSIVRPGLCLINPITGAANTAVTFNGTNFSGTVAPEVYFGAEKAIGSYDYTNFTMPSTAGSEPKVPAFDPPFPKEVLSRVKVNTEYSNPLTFRVQAGIATSFYECTQDPDKLTCLNPQNSDGQCDTGEFCNDSCQCEELLPCDSEETTPACEPGTCTAGYYCYNSATHGVDYRKKDCFCYPATPCDQDTTTPACDVSNTKCPTGYFCDSLSNCTCQPTRNISEDSTYNYSFLTGIQPGACSDNEGMCVPNDANCPNVGEYCHPTSCDCVAIPAPQCVVGDNGVYLDGNGDYVEVATDASLNLTEFSWSAWIKPEAKNDGSTDITTYDTVLSRSTTDGYNVVNLRADAFLNKWGAFIWTNPVNSGSEPGPTLQLTGDYTFESNQWYHLALTLNSSAANFYINGELKGSGVLSGAINYSTYAGKLLIGADLDPIAGVNNSDIFKGVIDEVAIYKRALTNKEILYLSQNRSVAASDLVSFWRLNDCSDTLTALEDSVSNNDATKIGNASCAAGNFLCEEAIPGVGSPCDLETTIRGCQPNTTYCENYNLVCETRSCTCQLPAEVSYEDSAYTWFFDTTTARPKVMELCNRTIDCDPYSLSSPTPFNKAATENAGYKVSRARPDDGEVKIDAVISVQFDRGMYQPSLASHIKLYSCGTGASPGTCSPTETSIRVTAADTYINAVPDNLLEVNTWYEVVLDAPNILGENGLPLVGNVNGNSDSQYRWRFKTESSGILSQVGCLYIKPNRASLFQYDQRRKYDALPSAADNVCVDIRPESCNDGYGWNTVDPAPTDAVETRAYIVPNGGHNAASPPDSYDVSQNDEKATAAAHTESIYDNPDYTSVKATCNFSPPANKSVDGFSDLTIDFSAPYVIDRFPDCGTACLNSRIGATFSKTMDDASVQGAMELYICYDDPSCADADEVTSFTPPTLQPSPPEAQNTYIGDINLTACDIVEGYCLLPNTYYQVIISNTAVSQNENIPLAGLNYDFDSNGERDSYAWIFKTQADFGFCQPDEINVAPHPKQARRNQTIYYSSRPKTFPDSCDPAFGQRLNPWIYNWDWSSEVASGWTGGLCSTDPTALDYFGYAVADLQSMNSGNPVLYCSADTTPPHSKTGTLRDSCGNGRIDIGEDCDDGNVISNDGCSDICLDEGSLFAEIQPLSGNNISWQFDTGLRIDGSLPAFIAAHRSNLLLFQDSAGEIFLVAAHNINNASATFADRGNFTWEFSADANPALIALDGPDDDFDFTDNGAEDFWNFGTVGDPSYPDYPDYPYSLDNKLRSDWAWSTGADGMIIKLSSADWTVKIEVENWTTTIGGVRQNPDLVDWEFQLAGGSSISLNKNQPVLLKKIGNRFYLAQASSLTITDTSICGNGRLELGEECEPAISSSYCSVACLWAGNNNYSEVCGNGILERNEECDPPGAGCANNCLLSGSVRTRSVCGDGQIGLGEECDEGELARGGSLSDGICDANCLIKNPAAISFCQSNSNNRIDFKAGACSGPSDCGSGWACRQLSFVTGNTNTGSVCGNSRIERGEECDLGGICSDNGNPCASYNLSNCTNPWTATCQPQNTLGCTNQCIHAGSYYETIGSDVGAYQVALTNPDVDGEAWMQSWINDYEPTRGPFGAGRLIVGTGASWEGFGIIDWWPDCGTACVNAEIGAQFNEAVDTDTLISSNIHLFECVGNDNCDVILSGTSWVPGTGVRELTASSDFIISNSGVTLTGPQYDAFTIDITTTYYSIGGVPALKPNTSYRIIVMPGVQSEDDNQSLQSLNFDGTGDEVPDAFSWVLTTRPDASLCQIDRVEVNPKDKSLPVGGGRENRLVYSARPWSAPDSCDPEFGQRLVAWSYDWRWDDYNLDITDAVKFLTPRDANVTPSLTNHYDGCGNGRLDYGEDCDFNDLRLTTEQAALCGTNCQWEGTSQCSLPPAIQNGNFETAENIDSSDNANWRVESDPTGGWVGSGQIQNTEVRSGNSAAQADVTTAGTGWGIQLSNKNQANLLQPGDYRLSLWVKTGIPLSIGIQPNGDPTPDGNGNSVYTPHYKNCSVSPSSNWQQVTCDFTIPSSGPVSGPLKVLYHIRTTQIGTFYVDDVEFIPTTLNCCGNNIIEPGEECEGSTYCSNRCLNTGNSFTSAVCGDGMVEGDEMCDFGTEPNGNDADGCTDTCRYSGAVPGTGSLCGDVKVEKGEECEKNPDGTWPANCIVSNSNICDSLTSESSCKPSNTCYWTGNDCLPRPCLLTSRSIDVCRANSTTTPRLAVDFSQYPIPTGGCKLNYSQINLSALDGNDDWNRSSCGNRIIEPGEECDDGNTVTEDGCGNNCLFSGSIRTDGRIDPYQVVETLPITLTLQQVREEIQAWHDLQEEIVGRTILTVVGGPDVPFKIIGHQPPTSGEQWCRNVALWAVFSQPLDLASLGGHCSGTVDTCITASDCSADEAVCVYENFKLIDCSAPGNLCNLSNSGGAPSLINEIDYKEIQGSCNQNNHCVYPLADSDNVPFTDSFCATSADCRGSRLKITALSGDGFLAANHSYQIYFRDDNIKSTTGDILPASSSWNFSTNADFCQCDYVGVRVDYTAAGNETTRDFFTCAGDGCGAKTEVQLDDDYKPQYICNSGERLRMVCSVVASDSSECPDSSDTTDGKADCAYGTGGVAGNQHYYEAQCYDVINPQNTRIAIGLSDVTYEWSETDADNIIYLTDAETDTNNDNYYVTPGDNNTPAGKNGKAYVKVTGTAILGPGGRESTASQRVAITNFICENPWPNLPPYEDVYSNCTSSVSGTCYDTNFQIFYCQDFAQAGDTDDLPSLPVISSINTVFAQQVGSRVLKEFILPVCNNYEECGDVTDFSSNALGIRVFSNPLHLAPMTWYRSGLCQYREGGDGVNVGVVTADAEFDDLCFGSSDCPVSSYCDNDGNGTIEPATETTECSQTAPCTNRRCLPLVNICRMNVPTQGSPTVIAAGVDGYQAIRDGRTVYVGATNLDLTSSHLYSDIYALSYSQNASSQTIEIFNRILDPAQQKGVWYFNPEPEFTNQRICRNVGYFENSNTLCGTSLTPITDIGETQSTYCDAISNANDCNNATTYGCYWSNELNDCLASPCLPIYCHNNFECPNLECNAAKEEVIRDAKRFADLREVQIALRNYFRSSSEYPTLQSGTYIPQTTFSLWPSWQDNFGAALNGLSYRDPINRFVGCSEYYCDDNGDGRVDASVDTLCNLGDITDCANNPRICLPLDPDQLRTCWDELSLRFSCPTGAFSYAYYSEDNGLDYELYTNFEYDRTGSWRTADGTTIPFYELPLSSVSARQCKVLNFEIHQATIGGGTVTPTCSTVRCYGPDNDPTKVNDPSSPVASCGDCDSGPGNFCSGDADQDGVCDIDDEDNCDPTADCATPSDCYNPDQKDSNSDELGDVCDNLCSGDTDADGWCDEFDNCRTVHNCSATSWAGSPPEQACGTGGDDSDEDSFGNACDPCTDLDKDGWWDVGTGANDCPRDNCPAYENWQPTGDPTRVSLDHFGYCTDANGLPILSQTCCLSSGQYSSGVCDSRPNCNGSGCNGETFSNTYPAYNPLQEDYDNDLTGYICDFCIDFDDDGFGDYPFYTHNSDPSSVFAPPAGIGPGLTSGQFEHFEGCQAPVEDFTPWQPPPRCGDGLKEGAEECDCGDSGLPSTDINNPFTCTTFNGTVCTGVNCDYCDSSCHQQKFDCTTGVTPVNDPDDDGLRNETNCDNCFGDSNPLQEDEDDDDVGNVCDNCIDVSNLSQADGDDDGKGNACDNCINGVGLCNTTTNIDNCYNPSQVDFDSDGMGDACDNNTGYETTNLLEGHTDLDPSPDRFMTVNDVDFIYSVDAPIGPASAGGNGLGIWSFNAEGSCNSGDTSYAIAGQTGIGNIGQPVAHQGSTSLVYTYTTGSNYCTIWTPEIAARPGDAFKVSGYLWRPNNGVDFYVDGHDGICSVVLPNSYVLPTPESYFPDPSSLQSQSIYSGSAAQWSHSCGSPTLYNNGLTADCTPLNYCARLGIEPNYYCTNGCFTDRNAGFNQGCSNVFNEWCYFEWNLTIPLPVTDHPQQSRMTFRISGSGSINNEKVYIDGLSITKTSAAAVDDSWDHEVKGDHTSNVNVDSPNVVVTSTSNCPHQAGVDGGDVNLTPDNEDYCYDWQDLIFPFSPITDGGQLVRPVPPATAVYGAGDMQRYTTYVNNTSPSSVTRSITIQSCAEQCSLWLDRVKQWSSIANPAPYTFSLTFPAGQSRVDIYIDDVNPAHGNINFQYSPALSSIFLINSTP